MQVLRDRRASVPIITAVMMLPLLGAAGFAFDAGRFYLSQTRDQAAADIATAAAAMAYNATGSQSTAAMQACVAAAMNGVSVTCTTPLPTTVQTTFGTSPDGSGATGVHVVVASTLKLSAFGSLLNGGSKSATLPVKAAAWAKINADNPPCLEALVPSTAGIAGITMSGSATIAAAGCSVQSGGSINVSGTGSVGTVASPATSVYTAGSIVKSGSGAVNSTTAPKTSYAFPAPATTPTAPADPFASNATVVADFNHLTAVKTDSAISPVSLGSAPSGGASPTLACGTKATPTAVASGTYANLTFGGTNCYYNVTAPISVSGTMTLSGSNATVNFIGTGTNNINKLVASGTGSLINASGNIFNVYNGVSDTTWASDLSIGCKTTFYAGGCTSTDADTNTYNIAGGINNSQSEIAFGNGTFNIAGGITANDCGCVANNGGQDGVYFGAGTFQIAGGITNNEAVLVFGDGNYTISGGISMNNGAACSSPPVNETKFGNGTNFIVTDTGITMNGGCFIFGNSTNHDINAGSASSKAIYNSSGSLAVTFGSGTYTLNGSMTLASQASATGSNMTLVLSGDTNLTAGATINWSAPTASPFLILTQSSDGGSGGTSPAAVGLSGGTSGTQFTGAVYAPNGGVVLSGSGAINALAPAGTCFSLVARVINQSGGTATAGVCPGTGSTTGGKVALVQ